MDPYKYYQYRRSQRSGVRSVDYLKMVAMCATIAKDESKEQARLNGFAKRKRGSPSPCEERLRRDADGHIRQFNAYDTDWYYRYVSNPDLEGKQFQRKFRRRFRCSYETFLKHLDEVKRSPLFKIWEDGRTDCVGNPSCPIELLLLGVLRYLGRGWCFDDLSEQTCISEATHHRFLHVYLLFGSTTMFEKCLLVLLRHEHVPHVVKNRGPHF